jgi:hypothetical protein
VKRFIGMLFIGFGLLCGPAASASGDGLPVGNVQAGPDGVASRTGDLRYQAITAGQSTQVLAVRRNGGQLMSWRTLRGRYGLPVVALDGTADGLSADGRTLVLIRPRAAFPRERTTFAVLDAPRLRHQETVRLRGDFSFDAISPDGGLVYLIQYTSRRDPTRYDVRAYDTRKGRLLPDPIVDPREPGEDMRGFPVTRVFSPDGQWAYTLYDGAGEHPFVHALNTRELTAVCIDLHGLTGRRDLMDLRLDVQPGGDELSVVNARREPLYVVDARTFEVSEATSGADASGGDGGVPGTMWLGGAVLLTAGAIVLMVRRRRTVAPT